MDRPEIPVNPAPPRRAFKPRLPTGRTCQNPEVRAAYLRALPLLGHDGACEVVNVTHRSVRRYASRNPEFAKARYEALNRWKFAALEDMRARFTAILQDSSSSADHLELAVKWLCANSDPATFKDPDVLAKQAEIVARVSATRTLDGASRQRLPHLLRPPAEKPAKQPEPAGNSDLAEIMSHAGVQG